MRTSSFLSALALAWLLTAAGVSAHEGHGIPGALPPGPHGGVVAESSEPEAHGHEHGGGGHGQDHGGDREMHDYGSDAKGRPHAHPPTVGTKEYFFEAVYKSGKLKVYPLTFGASPTSFVSVPAKNLKNVVLKAEVPRRKTVQVLKPAVTDDAFEAAYDSKKANRFIVHVAAEIDGKKRVSKLQIEKNK